ncbi:MAG: pilus assembly PilX N-terminal domain-containing protein [Candidatus Eremiobacteraeota bacterium]|nr:pilus assembly PilX N-terminal domain-containing protein [Candidatus Eremiobacteraeota bacterium]
MFSRKGERGLAVAITLMVLTIICIIAFALSTNGVRALNFTNEDKYHKQAFYAAESGIQKILLKYRNNESGWASGIASSPMPSPCSTGMGTKFYVGVYQSGQMPPVPCASPVPTGMLYFLSTGLAHNDRSVQKIGVMIKDTRNQGFRYALATAGSINFKNTSIQGSVKCNGNMTFVSQLDTYPDYTSREGKVFCCAQIQNGSKQITMYTTPTMTPPGVAAPTPTPTVTIPLKARNGITGYPSKVTNPYGDVTPCDSSDDTLPFNCEGYTEPTEVPGYDQCLPNPDMTQLLNGAVTNNTSNFNGTVNLGSNGKVWFPYSSGDPISGGGVKITGVTGSGTIIVGSFGNPGKMAWKITNATPNVNIVVVDGGTAAGWVNNGTLGTAKLSFDANASINGLVYCHGPEITQGQTTFTGSVISYGTGASGFIEGAQTNFYYNTPSCDGFTQWFGSASGKNTVTSVSWERY